MNAFSADRKIYLKIGKSLVDRHSTQLSAQLAVFQSALINFASEHAAVIKKNPEFRDKFTKMCNSIGVDPLELLLFVDSSSKKTDAFYMGLAVRVVEICQETRDINGGLISLKELHSRLQETFTVPLKVSEDDVTLSLDLLKGLGKGYETLRISDLLWVKFSGPAGSGTISNDERKIYELCVFTGGYTTHKLLRDNYGWEQVRAKSVIDDMIRNGLLWVDAQGPNGQWQYWEPSWISHD